MVSCDVDCVFDLSFEGFVLFSGGENLARSHFRTTNSQQKVGKPKQGDCKDRFSLPPRKNHIFFPPLSLYLPCFSAEPAPRLALRIDGLFLIIRLVQTCVLSRVFSGCLMFLLSVKCAKRKKKDVPLHICTLINMCAPT